MYSTNIKKIICIYNGRFQPFGLHHLKIYKWLEDQFDEVYITTSNVSGGDDNPLNFEEKVNHMINMSIPVDRIVEEKIPCDPKNVLKKFDSKTTAVVQTFYEEWNVDALPLVDNESYYQNYNDVRRSNRLYISYTKATTFWFYP